MQYSKTPTGNILMKAATNSLFERCSLALLTVSDERQIELSNKLQIVEQMRADLFFDSITWFDDGIRFFESVSDEVNLSEIFVACQSWAFVDLRAGEVPYLFTPCPEGVHRYQLTVTRVGNAYYTARGEDPLDRYVTSRFPLHSFLR